MMRNPQKLGVRQNPKDAAWRSSTAIFCCGVAGWNIPHIHIAQQWNSVATKGPGCFFGWTKWSARDYLRSIQNAWFLLDGRILPDRVWDTSMVSWIPMGFGGYRAPPPSLRPRSRPRSKQPPSARLPLWADRHAGTADGGGHCHSPNSLEQETQQPGRQAAKCWSWTNLINLGKLPCKKKNRENCLGVKRK